MTEDSPPVVYDEVSICAYSDFDEDEKEKEFVNDVLEIDLPREFYNRTADIDREESFEYEIFFGESGPDSPSEAENNIQLNNADEHEYDMHTHLYFDSTTRTEVQEVFDKIVDLKGSVDVSIVTIEATIPIEFDSLELPISSNTDGKVNGVRFSNDDGNFLIQDLSPDDPDSDLEEAIYVRYSDSSWRGTIRSGNSFVERLLDEYEEYIENFRPQ